MKSRIAAICLGLFVMGSSFARPEYKDFTAEARALADSLARQQAPEESLLNLIEEADSTLNRHSVDSTSTRPTGDSLSHTLIKADTTDSILPAIRFLRMLERADSLRALQEPSRGIPVNPLFLPIIFDNQKSTPQQSLKYTPRDSTTLSPMQFSVDTSWLQRELRSQELREMAQNYVIVYHPYLVRYNRDNLPEVPKQYIIESDPVKQILVIKEKPLVVNETLETEKIKIKRWIINFQSAIQFSQVYISENWYQGGNSNVNLLSDQQFSIKYNDPKEKRILFENLIQWRLNLNSAPEDTLRAIRVSEDLFQINSKFGLKAFTNWYYSANLNFKTQFLTSYAVNTNNKVASFLSPGELNVGLGMSYQYKNDKKHFDSSVSLSPLSYNLRFIIDKDMNAADFGIEKGMSVNQIGSSLEGRFKWEFYRNIVWTCRLFYFTNYEHIQGDLENTFDFVLNRFFSTKLFVHLRYDDALAKGCLDHFQIKELLSFGFNYKF